MNPPAHRARPALCLTSGAGPQVRARLHALNLPAWTPDSVPSPAALVVVGLGVGAGEALRIAGGATPAALVLQTDGLLGSRWPWSRRRAEAALTEALSALRCPVLLVHRRDAEPSAARRMLTRIRAHAELLLVDDAPEDPALGSAVEGFLRDTLASALP